MCNTAARVKRDKEHTALIDYSNYFDDDDDDDDDGSLFLIAP